MGKRMKSEDFKVMIQCLIVIDGENKPDTRRIIPLSLHTLRIPEVKAYAKANET